MAYIGFQVVRVTGFGQHEVVSTHFSFGLAYHALHKVAASVRYPKISLDADGRQLAIVRTGDTPYPSTPLSDKETVS